MDLAAAKLNHFERSGNSFFFLYRKPFTKSKIKLVNPIEYTHFTLYEIEDTGLLIGYKLVFSNKNFIYSDQFISCGEPPANSDNVCLILLNRHLAIIESADCQNVLVIGDI